MGMHGDAWVVLVLFVEQLRLTFQRMLNLDIGNPVQQLGSPKCVDSNDSVDSLRSDTSYVQVL